MVFILADDLGWHQLSAAAGRGPAAALLLSVDFSGDTIETAIPRCLTAGLTPVPVVLPSCHAQA
jgi:hypothetical protein